MNAIRLLCLFVVFSFLYCSSDEVNAEKVYSKLKAIDGDYHLDLDEGNFFSWENQDSLIVGTAYSKTNQDTVLTELHSFEIVSDSVQYQVTLFNNQLPLTINYFLDQVEDGQYTFITEEREFPKSLAYQLNETNLQITRKGILVGSEEQFTETYVKQ